MNYNSRVLVFAASSPTLTLIRGIPGGGKSTLAKQLTKAKDLLHKTIHLENDMYWETQGVYQYDETRMYEAINWTLKTAKILLSQNLDVVVANTFTQFKEAEKFISYCVSRQFNLHVYTLDPEVNYGNTHGVPDEKVAIMKARFESHYDFIAKVEQLKKPVTGNNLSALMKA